LLRRNGIPSEVEVMRRSLSRALSDAGRRKITHAVIVGSKELSRGMVILRNMENKMQEESKIEDLPGKLKI
jgi:histidyl-tRNA synthetase